MRKVVVALLALTVVSFVSPFSYLPNPLGLAYLLVGAYTYDARLPFISNRFVTIFRSDVEAALRPKLDALLGATGLDLLDPEQPLQGYQIESVSYGAGDWDTFFRLSPDGNRLLLWNGRGGFWTVPLETKLAEVS